MQIEHKSRLTIVTKYEPSRSYAGAGMSAKDNYGRGIKCSYDYALGIDENHAAAALAFSEQYNVIGKLISCEAVTGGLFVLMPE